MSDDADAAYDFTGMDGGLERELLMRMTMAYGTALFNIRGLA